MPATVAIIGLGPYPFSGYAQAREWLPPPVEVTRLADLDGTLFGNPVLIKGSPRGGFVVADRHDGLLSEYSPQGDRMWRSGGSGEGPGEFLRVIELEFDAAGNLLVFDLGTGRITTIDPDGGLVGSARFPEGSQILPETFDPGSWSTLTHTDRRRTLWSSYAKTDLAPRRTVPTPRGITFDQDIVGERWATNFADGAAVVYHRWSSRMAFLAADGSVQSVVEGVEPISFPNGAFVEVAGEGFSGSGYKVDPEAIEATRSASAGEDRLLVLFLGATKEAGRIVDTYSRDGVYQGSYLLPEDVRGRSIAALPEGRFAVLDTDFIPTVWIFSVQR